MHDMFRGATAFNQNLCDFGDSANFSKLYGSFQDMFTASGCQYTNRPTGADGPWCAAATCPAS